MKELSIEEKAKRYDEALEKSKILYEQGTITESLCYVFPELKESEDDGIIKDMIETIKKEAKDFPSSVIAEKSKSWLAWLEKQGENKLIDKVKPKFKVKYGGSEYNVFETKDIASVTYYGIEDEPNHIDYIKAENCEIISGYAIKENASPYPTKPAVFSEQNHAWSEGDEEILYSIINDIEIRSGRITLAELKESYTKQIDWLKSLKERIYPKQEWSEDDIEMIDYVASILNSNFNENDKFDDDKPCVGALVDRLKSLKDRYTWKPSDEQMIALDSVLVYNPPCSNECRNHLITLCNDLEKLRKE